MSGAKPSSSDWITGGPYLWGKRPVPSGYGPEIYKHVRNLLSDVSGAVPNRLFIMEERILGTLAALLLLNLFLS
jgi:hypothetical protein